ncbi:MAG: hypothetical protein KatS3mg129_0753 [Leptospiraceae bacterium]|nr:MAG: hypothetical protein KatS3mg129_0753 [Leptospiraceae bacterium]
MDIKQITKFVVLILLLFIKCEKAPEYEKKEELRNLYILLNIPDKNQLKNICIDSENKALTCISNPVNTNIYLSTITTFYQISITSQNPEDYCPLIIDSPTFKNGNFSNDAKRCHFTCNQQYWENTNCSNFTSALNEYSNCLPGVWIKNCENEILKKCLESCFLDGDPIWFISSD